MYKFGITSHQDKSIMYYKPQNKHEFCQSWFQTRDTAFLPFVHAWKSCIYVVSLHLCVCLVCVCMLCVCAAAKCD